MDLSSRPRLSEAIGWAPIAITLAILLFVLYRLTFVPRDANASVAPTSVPSTIQATATPGLQFVSDVQTVTPSPQGRPVATAPAEIATLNIAEKAAAQASTNDMQAFSPSPTAVPPPSPTTTAPLAAVRGAVIAPSGIPTATATANVEWTGSYVIKSGDTMSTIASRLGVTMQELQEHNKIVEANRIQAGQKLIVPTRP